MRSLVFSPFLVTKQANCLNLQSSQKCWRKIGSTCGHPARTFWSASQRWKGPGIQIHWCLKVSSKHKNIIKICFWKKKIVKQARKKISTQISSWKNKLPNNISPTFPPSHPLLKQSEFWWILVITQNPFSLHYPSYPLHNIQNWVGFFQIVTTLLFPHSDLLALITTWTILIAHFHHSDFHLHNLGFSSCTHSQT